MGSPNPADTKATLHASLDSPANSCTWSTQASCRCRTHCGNATHDSTEKTFYSLRSTKRYHASEAASRHVVNRRREARDGIPCVHKLCAHICPMHTSLIHSNKGRTPVTFITLRCKMPRLNARRLCIGIHMRATATVVYTHQWCKWPHPDHHVTSHGMLPRDECRHVLHTPAYHTTGTTRDVIWPTVKSITWR